MAVKDPDLAKASHDLLDDPRRISEHLQQAGAQTGGSPAFRSSNALAGIVDRKVVIEALATSDARALAAELERLGLEDTAVFGWMVSGRLAISTIPALKDVQSLKFARLVKAMTQVGDATSQGDVAMGADVARSSFGVYGTGVTVGVLSDSFDCLGGAAAGVASGDLPAGIRVLQEGPCPAADEARALAEVIHDIAPGVALPSTAPSMASPVSPRASSISATAGAQVITDDVIYFAEPMFQDGIVAQAVYRVKTLGVSYFSAAGNQARRSYESSFRPSGQFVQHRPRVGRGA